MVSVEGGSRGRGLAYYNCMEPALSVGRNTLLFGMISYAMTSGWANIIIGGTARLGGYLVGRCIVLLTKLVLTPFSLAYNHPAFSVAVAITVIAMALWQSKIREAAASLQSEKKKQEAAIDPAQVARELRMKKLPLELRDAVQAWISTYQEIVEILQTEGSPLQVEKFREIKELVANLITELKTTRVKDAVKSMQDDFMSVEVRMGTHFRYSGTLPLDPQLVKQFKGVLERVNKIVEGIREGTITI